MLQISEFMIRFGLQTYEIFSLIRLGIVKLAEPNKPKKTNIRLQGKNKITILSLSHKVQIQLAR